MGGSQSTARRTPPARPQPTPQPAPQRPAVSPHDMAVLELKVQRDKLKQYQRRIAAVMERETEVAREMVRRGNRDLARLALQKRAYQQGLIDSSSKQLLSLEEMVLGMEYAAVEAQVVAGLKAGNAVLADLQREMSLDAVDELMAETAEAIAYQDEVSRRISSSLTSEQQTSAEDELDALLAAVQREQAASLPSVPKTVPAAASKAEPVSESESEDERTAVPA